MEFVAAKCTQCGADIKVEKAKEAANCEHCGTEIKVDEAKEAASCSRKDTNIALICLGICVAIAVITVFRLVADILS